MKNILLCCSAGMSTSLLVTQMKQYAKLKCYNINIWAVPSDKIQDEIKHANIILLGPQIRHMKEEVESLVQEYKRTNDKTLVEIIPISLYGTMSGDKVVEFALNLS